MQGFQKYITHAQTHLLLEIPKEKYEAIQVRCLIKQTKERKIFGSPLAYLFFILMLFGQENILVDWTLGFYLDYRLDVGKK